MKILNKIVDGIDDSRIVKQAYRVFYYVIGVLCVISTIAAAIYGYKMIAEINHPTIKTWSKFVFWFLFTVYTAIQIVAGVILFLYWKKHGDAIGKTPCKYPNNLVLADLLQTLNNSYVFMGLASIVVGCILLYLGFILTGEEHFYDGMFLKVSGILIGIIVGCIIVFMIMTTIVSFITEKIKQRIQISDDLSDVADVMRSAQIVKDEIVVAEPELHTQPDLPACPDCGTQLPPNTATCPNCGCPVNN